MNPELIITAIGGVISLINTVLPLLPKGSAGSGAMGKIVDAVTGLGPLATDQIGSTYTGLKNIIATLGAHPATTADQLVALQAFDKQVDDDWAAIEKDFDPDAQTA